MFRKEIMINDSLSAISHQPSAKKATHPLSAISHPPSANQKGFSQLLIVSILAAGIIAGSLLIKNSTSFLPKAADNCVEIETQFIACSNECNQALEDLNNCREEGCPETETLVADCQIRNKCRDLNTQLLECRNNPTTETDSNSKNDSGQNNDGQEELHPVDSEKMTACGNDTDCKNELCAADEVTFCDNRSGTPRAIRKTGGYYDPGHSLKDANGCVFDFFEVPSKNSECAKSESKSGDVVYTTEEESKKIDEDREKTRSEREKSTGISSSSSSSKDTIACTPAATKTYYDAKVANNLARFYAIKNGAGGLCVPADLGVPTKDDITVNGVEGRLMMCSSKDNPPKLYWMIATYESNSRLIQVPETQKTSPDANTIEAGFKNLQKARCIGGLDSGDICKGA